MKFSILNLLLIVTAVAAIMGLFAMRLSNIALQNELKSHRAELIAAQKNYEKELLTLRQEAGYLTIKDRSKIYALKLKSASTSEWTYRVYLPEGRNYYFGCKINSLPLGDRLPTVNVPPDPTTISTIGTNSVGVGCAPGNYVVRLSISQDQGQWSYRLNLRESGDAGAGTTGGQVIRMDSGHWPEKADWISAGGVAYQRDFPADKVVTLLNLRAMSHDVRSSADSDQGALLWVNAVD